MILGLTGGIGCGKSAVLNILQEDYGFHIFEADRIAHEIMEPGGRCYDKIVQSFGTEILDNNGVIDRNQFGMIVFSDKEKLSTLNSIVHPATIEEIFARITKIRNVDCNAHFVIEAALLIESGCNKLCDYVWYIYAKPSIRRQRLKEYRNYSDEKIDAVMKNQLDKETFARIADAVIDNSHELLETKKQIEENLSKIISMTT